MYILNKHIEINRKERNKEEKSRKSVNTHQAENAG